MTDTSTDTIEISPTTLRFKEAYLRMAREASYRPQAPGDGVGNIDLSSAELRDRARLDGEALTYAAGFAEEEDGLEFWIGCSNYETARAFVFAIEAARQLASGSDGNNTALQLLKLAIADVELAQQARR